jgi:hypothetical protein
MKVVQVEEEALIELQTKGDYLVNFGNQEELEGCWQSSSLEGYSLPP